MHDQNKNSSEYPKWVNTLILIGVAWFLWVIFAGGTAHDGDATVLVFPNTDNTKNYELTGDVTKKTELEYLLFPKDSYSISSFNWPNGGYANFNDCIVSEPKSMVKCTSTSGDTYGIKVSEFTGESSAE